MAYDLSTGRAVKVAEAVGDAYHLGISAEQGDRLSIYHSVAGDPESLRDIAQIIADHPTGTES